MPATNPVVRYLLQSLLEVIPTFTPLEPYRDSNLNRWRLGGSYQLLSCSRSQITLSVNNIREYSAAMFADGQHLINQVAEHRAHLLNSLSTGKESSPTWTFVTVYYMALFAAMAFTRAGNSAVVYLDSDAVKQYCGNATIRPSGGAFRISGSSVQPNEIKISSAKRSHFHEAAWLSCHNDLEGAFKWIEAQSVNRSASADELLNMRALKLFLNIKFQAGPTWPSQLRNALNYRPGYSYRSVIRHNFLHLQSHLLKPKFATFDDVIAHGEAVQQRLLKITTPLEAPNDAIELLIVYSLLLEHYANTAFHAVCEKQGLVYSARGQRAQYKKLHGLNPNSVILEI